MEKGAYSGYQSTLIGKNSPLSLENKILIYKTVLKPVWTYGNELCGCATKSNTAIIQRYQYKLLRTMANAPWYVSNHALHTDLHIPYVRTVFQERITIHRTTLTSHPNPLMEPLLETLHNRRLQRRWNALRNHRWMPPLTTADHNSTLAQRKQ